MDPRERLRMALLGAGCTRCGRTYPAQGIHVLAQREAIAFVQLECPFCATQTLALVTGVPLEGDDVDASELGPAEVRRTETLTRGSAPGRGGRPGRPPEEPPISDEDVDDMRTFLAGYRGDLRTLVARRGRGSGADPR